MFLRTLLGSWFWSLLSVRRIYLTKSSDIKYMLTNKEINADRTDSKWFADCAAFKNVKLTNVELSLSTWMQWKNWRTHKLFSKVVVRGNTFFRVLSWTFVFAEIRQDGTIIFISSVPLHIFFFLKDNEIFGLKWVSYVLTLNLLKKFPKSFLFEQDISCLPG